MAVNLTNANSALKSAYLDVVAEQLNNNVSPFLAAIEKSTENVWGKEVRKLVTYGRNGGIGAGTEDGSLPAAAGNSYEQFVTTLKNLYGVIEISDKAIRASENNSGAFVSLLNAEMEGLIKASTYNFGRMLFGNGSGVLATVTSGLNNQAYVDTVKNLYVGAVVDVYEDGYCMHSSLKVEKIDPKEKLVYFSNLTNDLLKDQVIAIQGSLDKEITGISAIFDTTKPIYGLNRNGRDWLNPTIMTNAGEITESKIQTVLDTVEEKSGYQPNFIICSWGVRRALINLFSANKRVIDTTELKGGFKALSYNGIPIVVDRFCPEGTMYLLNTDQFALHQLCDWQWLEGDDGNVLKQVPGKPVYTATLVKYAELLCSCPCGQAMISGITEA